jgi:hypothetical protein
LASTSRTSAGPTSAAGVFHSFGCAFSTWRHKAR